MIWTVAWGAVAAAIGLWTLVAPDSYHRALFKHSTIVKPWYTPEQAASPLGQFLTRFVGFCILAFVGTIFYVMIHDLSSLPKSAPH